LRLQFKILFFLACFNLATGMVMALALPGTGYFGSGRLSTTGSTHEEYEEQFNATKVTKSWSATPFSGIPIVGDVFSGFYLLAVNWQFLIDGFPMLLTWISEAYLTTSEARAAFTIIANVLRALFAILMATFLIYLITGRDV